MQRKVPRPLQQRFEVRGSSHIPSRASRDQSPSHEDEGPWTGYTHHLAISLPILLTTKANFFAQPVTPCLKMVFLFLFGMGDPEIIPDTQSQVDRSPAHHSSHPPRWPFVQRCYLASVPPVPSIHQPIFHLQPAVPFCFHSICHHVQKTRAQGCNNSYYELRGYELRTIHLGCSPPASWVNTATKWGAKTQRGKIWRTLICFCHV